MTTHTQPRTTPLLTINGVSKNFGATKALDNVHLTVNAGEIVALVGQNGCGKSTLVKILAGVHHAEPGGTIEVRDGRGIPLDATGAHQRALHFIHQDLGLLPLLSTTENLSLGRAVGVRSLRPGGGRKEHLRAERLLGRFGAEIDVRAPVLSLTPAERAIVAIARALDGWERPDNVLVLDEPTTAFHRDEVARLFQAVRHVVAQGAGVLFISHRLDEVRSLADRVIALRDGRIVAEAAVCDVDDETLVKAIVGRSIAPTERKANPAADEIAIEVTGLSGTRVSGVSFAVSRGEILGVAGVLGSGREELAGLLFGSGRATAGTVQVRGAKMRLGSPSAAIEQGLALVPADRHRHGAVMTMSMRENLLLPELARRRGTGLANLKSRTERRESEAWCVTVGLRPPRPEQSMNQFSGGNQQKVVVAKWLRVRPEVLLLEEPTQGVDVGAKASIYELISQAAADGAGVIVCSSDVKELVTICDRILVLDGGRVERELAGEAMTEEAMLKATLGVPEQLVVDEHAGSGEVDR